MPPQRQPQCSYTEADVQLAIYDIENYQVRSVRHATSIYKVPERTIQRRRDGTRSRRDCEPNSKRLQKLEEEAIVEHILEQSLQGLPPSKAEVRDMADKLLSERGANPVGKNWVDNLIKRTPELQTR